MNTASVHCQERKFASGVLDAEHHLCTLAHMAEKIIYKNRLKDIRKGKKITAQALADTIGTSRSMIVSLESGERKLTSKWIEEISKALNCRASELLEAPSPIPIIGRIGAGGAIYAIDDYPQLKHSGDSARPDDPMESTSLPSIVSRENPLPESMVALCVEGESLEPFFRTGDLLFYSKRYTSEFDNFLGRVCIVETKDGLNAVKILRRGVSIGKYDLESTNAPTIKDQEIRWIARIEYTNTK